MFLLAKEESTIEKLALKPQSVVVLRHKIEVEEEERVFSFVTYKSQLIWIFDSHKGHQKLVNSPFIRQKVSQ